MGRRSGKPGLVAWHGPWPWGDTGGVRNCLTNSNSQRPPRANAANTIKALLGPVSDGNGADHRLFRREAKLRQFGREVRLVNECRRERAVKHMVFPAATHRG